MGAAVPRACRAWSIGGHADDRCDARQGAPLGLGRKRGEQRQAIGRSRGGRNTKIHALADAKGRLLSVLLTGGQAHDCPPAQRLIRRTKAAEKLLGDKAYDSAPAATMVEGSRHQAGRTQHRPTRKQPFSFDSKSYRQRHRIENAFCQTQGLPTHRHSIRQAGPKLPRLCLPRRCYRMVDLMSLDLSQPGAVQTNKSRSDELM